MTDQELWQRAVLQLRKEFDSLPAAMRLELAGAARRIRELKTGIHQIAADSGAAAICAECGGECCLCGKFHVTVIDLLIYLISDREIFTPRFDRGLCPYMGDAGCLMAAAYRPFNCITFNCERIEGLWEPASVERFYGLEQELRSSYAQLEQLFANRFVGGLLQNFQRDVLQGDGRFLKLKPAAGSRDKSFPDEQS